MHLFTHRNSGKTLTRGDRKRDSYTSSSTPNKNNGFYNTSAAVHKKSGGGTMRRRGRYTTIQEGKC